MVPHDEIEISKWGQELSRTNSIQELEDKLNTKDFKALPPAIISQLVRNIPIDYATGYDQKVFNVFANFVKRNSAIIVENAFNNSNIKDANDALQDLIQVFSSHNQYLVIKNYLVTEFEKYINTHVTHEDDLRFKAFEHYRKKFQAVGDSNEKIKQNFELKIINNTKINNINYIFKKKVYHPLICFALSPFSWALTRDESNGKTVIKNTKAGLLLALFSPVVFPATVATVSIALCLAGLTSLIHFLTLIPTKVMNSCLPNESALIAQKKSVASFFTHKDSDPYGDSFITPRAPSFDDPEKPKEVSVVRVTTGLSCSTK